MRLSKSAAVIVLAVSLAACQGQTGMGNKELGGTVIGAGLGGLLGAQFGSGAGQLAATALGVAIGGFIGNQIGASLDRADQAYANQASQTALTAPTGTPSSWSNSSSGNSGAVTPTSEFYYDARGYLCRDMEHLVQYADGSVQRIVVTECQLPDGSWEVRTKNA